MNPQKEFLKVLRFQKGLLACDEVRHYGGRADILAVDRNKKYIIEYEFKKTSYDLKHAEMKKSKYGTHKTWYKSWQYCKGKRIKGTVTKKPQTPHKFYFVVPHELYVKEEVYLKSKKCGVIVYDKKFEFTTMRNCRKKNSNLQKYEVATKNLLCRLSSAYVNLL